MGKQKANDCDCGDEAVVIVSVTDLNGILIDQEKMCRSCAKDLIGLGLEIGNVGVAPEKRA